MSRVLLLGCGMQGQAALYYLNSSPAVRSVTVVDSRPDFPEILRRYDPQRVRGVQLDAGDTAGIAALMQQADIVVELLPARFALATAQLAAQVGVNLVSAMYLVDPGEQDPARVGAQRAQVMALDRTVRARGLTLLTEFGLDPGLDLVVCKEAIAQLDEVHSLYSYGAGFPESAAVNNPLGYKFTWSIIGVLRSYLRPAVVIKEGVRTAIPATEMFAEANMHLLDLPELGGPLECFANGDASHYAELLGIAGTVRETGRFICRRPGHGAFWERMAKCGFLSPEPISVGGQMVSPLEFCASLLGSQPQFFYAPDERDVALVRVDVRGLKGGQPKRVVYQIIDTKDVRTQFTAMSRTTGFTAAIGAELILEGQIAGPGILTPLDVPFGAVAAKVGGVGIRIDRR